jgi:hypothetical protein
MEPMTPEMRALVARVRDRRLALQGDQQNLRSRYEEVMRWANPPWDPINRRIDPRSEQATAARGGTPKPHVDLVGQAITRWASLQAGAPISVRVQPKYVPPPLPANDPQMQLRDEKQYALDRAIAQNQSSQMEGQTAEWLEDANFHRTLLWGCWAKEAFGKSIFRSGWDPDVSHPTLELMENPSQVYYGWTKRYGNRRLGWVAVIEQMWPNEANRRFGLNIPMTDAGFIDIAAWTGSAEEGDMDQRVEQQDELRRYIYVEESWEMAAGASGKMGATYALIVADRVVDGPTWFPWKRLPFHVVENEHVPTYSHGKSMAEVAIPINASYDDMLDRQSQVIDFESGPRYKGLNFGTGGDEIDLPDPFHLVPLREGTDIQQIDTRVDFWPTQVHANELREAKYKATGLTPIAWGMSPNAQTSGRAMAAEWRAVELPLHSRLINLTPEIRDIISSWWDYAETYSKTLRDVAKGWRRFQVKWEPLDIRDKTEKTLDIIQQLNNHLIDPETAMEELGHENPDEMMAKVKMYLLDPVYNPLLQQQYLTLRQMAVNIQMMELQLQQAGGQPEAEGPEEGEAAAAAQGAQPPGGPVTEGQNQPGMSPGAGGLPLDVSVLMRPPMVGGMGNQTQITLPGATGGNVPR